MRTTLTTLIGLWLVLSVALAQAYDHVYYFHNDHLGTPQAMTDATGQKVWEAEYDAFGKATVTTETITNNLRFPGQYYDAETGLHYNYHRYYDPGTGRYLTPDPIGLWGGTNMYSYVSNDPINLVDPLGLIVINNSGKPILVKRERGTSWFTLPSGQTYPGKIDGVIGPNGRLAVPGKWYLPDNTIAVGPDGVPVCTAGLCKFLDKEWPDPNVDKTWLPPDNPPTDPSSIPNDRALCH